MYEAVTHHQALAAFADVTRLEGIVPAGEGPDAVVCLLAAPRGRPVSALARYHVAGWGDDVGMVAARSGAIR